MSGFANLEPVLTLELGLGQPLIVGAVASGSTMTCVPVVKGTLRSTDNGIFAGIIDAQCINGLDTSRLGPEKKFTRLNVNSVLKNNDGAIIHLSYDALIRMTPEILLIFTGHPDAKSTEFGDIFAQIKFEVADAKLSGLEENIFVGSGRMVLSGDGLSVEYKISRVLP